ncbi:MAG: hypothetical protein J6M43_07560 [Neisseriaceae bacterium]|nr:hypothetical protein [Neisseriaceae bacterium]
MNKRILSFVFIVLVIIGLMAAWFVYQYNHATTEYYWRDKTQAMKNSKAGYYALYTFLQKQHKDTPILYVKSMQQFEKFSQKNKNNAILLVGTANNGRDDFSNENTDILFKWVEKGNHLYIRQNKYINQKLGLEFKSVPEIKKKFPVKTTENKEIQAACQQEYNALQQYKKFGYSVNNDFVKNCANNLSMMVLPENNQSIFILETDIQKIDEKNLWGFDISKTPNIISVAKYPNDIATIVRVKKGKGTITVTGTYEIWDHPKEPTATQHIHLNRFDNAYFAAYLTQGKSNIYMMSPKGGSKNNIDKQLPFWLQLLKKYPLPMTLFVLLMILAIWQQIKRLGGKRQLDEKNSRPISAHFTAQGRLIAHNKEEYALLCEWQQELHNQWQRQFGKMPATRQTAVLLAKRLNVAADDIELWLHPIPQNLRANDVLRFVRSHQQLRKKQK